MATSKIGILALQGAFREHADALDRLGVAWEYVKKATDLESCDALVLPGGESSSMLKIIALSDLKKPLEKFMSSHPVMGTCAGLILLAKKVKPDQFSFPVLDIEVERNAYGSQLNSFTRMVTLEDGTSSEGSNTLEIPGTFIRAPRISRILSDSVTIMGTLDGEPVFIRQGTTFGLTFHPELSKDDTIHKLFIETI